jgi:nucleoside-diphosphate-sugar epimerase
MKPTAFVTGASGFIGRHLVGALLDRGFRVRAGVHNRRSIPELRDCRDCEIVDIDICDARSLKPALSGTDQLYHMAACINSHVSAEKLHRINVEGTRTLWETACSVGVKKALYCSSTAVYGLLSKHSRPITEDVPPRAVEPYGRSKLLGERLVQEIGSAGRLQFIIIRPAAVFGPGEHTPFGGELRHAAFTRLLLGGGFQEKTFSYVHVQDVAEAAVYLMERERIDCEVFNVSVDPPISYEHAFEAYLRALNRSGLRYLRQRMLGRISAGIGRSAFLSKWLHARGKDSIVFKVWRPGFDMTFSSRKLLAAEYKFRWNCFEDVLLSCINAGAAVPGARGAS